jgi:outer membrane protein
MGVFDGGLVLDQECLVDIFRRFAMQSFKIGIVVSSFLLFLASPSVGAEAMKIGVVDFQEILQKSSAGKSAQSEIEKEGKQMEEDLKKKKEDIDALNKKLERESLVLSREKREEREREIKIKVMDLKALQKKYMSDFKAHEGKLLKRIRDDVLQIVQSIGKKEGYTLIVEKRESGVLYVPDPVDLTEEVIRRYDARKR